MLVQLQQNPRNNYSVLYILDYALYVWLAQLVEQLAVNQRVVGSSPTSDAN